jgi:hypothetical protein
VRKRLTTGESSCVKGVAKDDLVQGRYAGGAMTAFQSYELQVLLVGGDPSPTRAAPMWRRVAMSRR